MTDATGRSFLSYRRSRIAEARLLIEAQHDIGIPTWQDIADLDEEHTDSKLREVLADPIIADAVAWLTPDVASSSTITKTELPGIVRRIDQKDEFFLIPVAAGGLAYGDITRVVGTYLGTHDLGQWNLRKVKADPIGADDAAVVAGYVLKRRMEAVHAQLAAGQPIPLGLYTRKKPPFTPGIALSLDWTHRFGGREALPGAWSERLLPALEAVAQACERWAPGRRIVAEGLCALPAALALGTAFLSTRRLEIEWAQFHPTRGTQHWSLDAKREASGFVGKVEPADVIADDLGVLVSVASDVRPAFGASRPSLPAFRGLVVVERPGPYPHDIETPGQALDLVRVVIETLKKARDDLQPRGGIHLFLSVPAGVAMMIGQLLNTVGPVQTYEHLTPDAVGIYHPAARLTPSA
ncbi:MAG TPA: SAVED domain-containing protein [Roseiarcus sp.]|nr:SAVED domain-containing protein [Roseiarcus sp.]